MEELRAALLEIYGDVDRVERWIKARGSCDPRSEASALRAWLASQDNLPTTQTPASGAN